MGSRDTKMKVVRRLKADELSPIHNRITTAMYETTRAFYASKRKNCAASLSSERVTLFKETTIQILWDLCDMCLQNAVNISKYKIAALLWEIGTHG